MIGTPAGVPYRRLSGYYFLFFATVGVYLPYWALYLRAIDFTIEQIGVVAAVVVGAKIVSTSVWGWVVDHTGERIRVIQITSGVAALLCIAILPIRDFGWLVFVMLLFSFFWSASLPQVEAATLSFLGESSHVYTTIRLWGSVGFIIVVSGLGVAFDTVDIRYVPLILLVVMVLLWLVTLTMDKAPVRHTGASAAEPSLRQTLKRPRVLALLVVCFLMLASHGPYYTFYSVYLEEHGYSGAEIGYLWALGVIAEVLLFLFMHRLINGGRLRGLFILSLFMATLRWLLIALFADRIVILAVAQLLHAGTFGIYHAVAIQYVHQFFCGRLQGRGQGLYSSVSFGGGFALGSLLAGFGWESWGASLCFGMASCAALLAAVIAWVFIGDEYSSG